MSQKRQTGKAILDDMGDSRFDLTTHSYNYYSGYKTPDHYHNEDQLLYGIHGVMTVRTAEDVWVVPPNRAVWIPAGLAHSTEMSGVVFMRTLWFKPKSLKKFSSTCHVFNISPLLKELIVHACKIEKLSRKDLKHKRVIEIILDELHEVQTLPLQLPMPVDPRALRITELIMKNPSSQKTLDEYVKKSGASKRTIERIFISETNLSFGKWRQQLRLIHAMKLLAAGSNVTEVSMDAGYNSPSAFISTFKKILGKSPGQYFEN